MNDDELKGFRAGYEHWNSHRSIPIRDCGYCEEYFDSVAAAFPRLIERLEASESTRSVMQEVLDSKEAMVETQAQQLAEARKDRLQISELLAVYETGRQAYIEQIAALKQELERVRGENLALHHAVSVEFPDQIQKIEWDVWNAHKDLNQECPCPLCSRLDEAIRQ